MRLSNFGFYIKLYTPIWPLLEKRALSIFDPVLFFIFLRHQHKRGAIVHLGCYNKIPGTEGTEWIIMNTNLCPTFLEARSLRSGCQDGKVSGLFQAVDFSLYLCMAEGVRELYGISFIRALIPFIKTPPSWPKQLLIYQHLQWLGFQHMNIWREHKHSDYTVVLFI